MEQTEIERKWLIDGFPPLPCQRESVVQQAYLSFHPAVRIRKNPASSAPYTLTIKSAGTLTRTEVELPLTESQYNALLPIAAAGATKRHCCYALPGGLVLECSLVDEGAPTSFYYAEVEFESEAAARAFVPPPYLGREVTEDPGFTMAEYCRRKAQAAGGSASGV